MLLVCFSDETPLVISILQMKKGKGQESSITDALDATPFSLHPYDVCRYREINCLTGCSPVIQSRRFHPLRRQRNLTSKQHGGKMRNATIPRRPDIRLTLATQRIASHYLDCASVRAMPCSAAAHLQYAASAKPGYILSLLRVKTTLSLLTNISNLFFTTKKLFKMANTVNSEVSGGCTSLESAMACSPFDTTTFGVKLGHRTRRRGQTISSMSTSKSPYVPFTCFVAISPDHLFQASPAASAEAQPLTRVKSEW